MNPSPSSPIEHSFLNQPLWAMGQPVAGEALPHINETATRARAGLLNLISATTIALLLFAPETDPVAYVGPFVLFDMLVAAATPYPNPQTGKTKVRSPTRAGSPKYSTTR